MQSVCQCSIVGLRFVAAVLKSRHCRLIQRYSIMKIRALKENEKEEMYELLYRAYAEHSERNPDLKNPDFFKSRIENDPFFNLDLNRVLELDGKLVARIGIYDRKMYFKGKTLRVGAIAGVGTDPLHRGKGYIKILAY